MENKNLEIAIAEEIKTEETSTEKEVSQMETKSNIVDLNSTSKIKGEKTHTKMVNAIREEALELISSTLNDSLGWKVEIGKDYGFGSNTIILTVFETEKSEEMHLRLQLSGTSPKVKSFKYPTVE